MFCLKGHDDHFVMNEFFFCFARVGLFKSCEHEPVCSVPKESCMYYLGTRLSVESRVRERCKRVPRIKIVLARLYASTYFSDHMKFPYH